MGQQRGSNSGGGGCGGGVGVFKKTNGKTVRVTLERVDIDNEEHDSEETNTETFMCPSVSATNDYTQSFVKIHEMVKL